ncbi:hypothetical protein [Chryseobacterium sp.]|uniref:hypothetical protein n=1 Tax=Chryseobacterium sp. TaxID=1871047 RepID=UPI002FC58FD9
MKIIIFLSTIFIIYSCTKTDCNDVKLGFYPDEYNLITEESNIDLTWIKIKGSNPITGEESNIMVHNNWILNSSDVEIGDTIIKKKGILDLTVHKKDTILLFNWHCKGKSFK